MLSKSVDIFYDTATIPNSNNGTNSRATLKFRNAAMDLIETALIDAEAGEWEGAEIGGGEVNFGFSVQNFDQAEAIIRAAVKGTPYEGIRNITRREIDTAELPLESADLSNVKPMSFLEMIGVLVFRRVPKRWQFLYQPQNLDRP